MEDFYGTCNVYIISNTYIHGLNICIYIIWIAQISVENVLIFECYEIMMLLISSMWTVALFPYCKPEVTAKQLAGWNENLQEYEKKTANEVSIGKMYKLAYCMMITRYVALALLGIVFIFTFLYIIYECLCIRNSNSHTVVY